MSSHVPGYRIIPPFTQNYIPSGNGVNADFMIIWREIVRILNSLSDPFNGINLKLQIDPTFLGERLPFTDRDAVFPDTAPGRLQKIDADRRNDMIENLRTTAIDRISLLLGPKIVRQMYKGPDGMALVPLWDSLQRFRDLYGTLTGKDQENLQAALMTKVEEPLADFFIRIDDLFTDLQRVGLFSSEVDRSSQLLKSLKNRGGYDTLIEDFEKINVTSQFHTTELIATYMTSREHKRLVPGAYVAHVTAAEHYETIQAMQIQMQHQFHEIQHLHGQLNFIVANQGGGSHAGGAALAQAAPKQFPHYCFHHGYNNSHPGVKCDFMIADIALPPGGAGARRKVGYSGAHQAAKQPSLIEGLQGSKRK